MDDLRVGDAERDDALRKLGDHLAAGRIDIEEHGERSSRIVSARTRGEITKEFADLPEPHPSLGDLRPAAVSGDQRATSRRRRRSRRSVARGSAKTVHSVAAELTALVWCATIAVIVMTDITGWLILVPIVYSAVISAWAKARGDQNAGGGPNGKQARE